MCAHGSLFCLPRKGPCPRPAETTLLIPSQSSRLTSGVHARVSPTVPTAIGHSGSHLTRPPQRLPECGSLSTHTIPCGCPWVKPSSHHTVPRDSRSLTGKLPSHCWCSLRVEASPWAPETGSCRGLPAPSSASGCKQPDVSSIFMAPAPGHLAPLEKSQPCSGNQAGSKLGGPQGFSASLPDGRFSCSNSPVPAAIAVRRLIHQVVLHSGPQGKNVPKSNGAQIYNPPHLTPSQNGCHGRSKRRWNRRAAAWRPLPRQSLPPRGGVHTARERARSSSSRSVCNGRRLCTSSNTPCCWPEGSVRGRVSLTRLPAPGRSAPAPPSAAPFSSTARLPACLT